MHLINDFTRVRGTLGSMIVLNCNFGILLAFLFGHYCDYFFVPKFVILLTTVFTVIFLFFPGIAVLLDETKSYLGELFSLLFLIRGRKHKFNFNFFSMDRTRRNPSNSTKT